MASKIEWNGEKASKLIYQEVEKRIKAACIVVTNHAKDLVGVEGAGKFGDTAREVARAKKKAKFARARAAVKAHNAAHGPTKKGGTGLIRAGIFGRARVTKAGGVSLRRKPKGGS